MPMAIATCWLSATARMATPMRLLRKNQVNRAKNSNVTMTPSTCIGGSEIGPKVIGVSPIGSDSARVCPPTVIGGSPRRMAPSPMVAMMTATTGRPNSGRSTTRSRAKLNRIMTATAATTAPMTGMPLTPARRRPRNPPA